ncbi:MAG: Aspartate-semialdehyde dehydrogenase 2 [bacterium ADurb.Bin270]|nr:aspartate-semialdehyde dehydrogenase [Myxococcales bacterium]OQA58562.1 MAG: Aspartate-semialdehyde dehydrogenase 2 [bacterium ADurb.Bin270]
MRKQYNIAVVGATGVVGGEILAVLEERNFPVGKILPLASDNSIGKEVQFGEKNLPVEILDEKSFTGVDIALFSAGGKVSEKHAPIAAGAGAVVIDNTSAFRNDPKIPLVVPEINPHRIADYKEKGIIANPNCSTIQMVMVLKPLHDVVPIKRVVVTTFQSVSGAGISAMEELSKQAVNLFSGAECDSKVFPHRIAFNCIPHIGKFNADGDTEEELKLVNETAKIMEDDSIKVSATAVRVPVFSGHAESLNIEFSDEISPSSVKEILSSASGVLLLDDPGLCRYPMAIEVTGKDEVFAGRIRKDPTVEFGISMWIAADNIRKGAALNAVQIAEILAKDYL